MKVLGIRVICWGALVGIVLLCGPARLALGAEAAEDAETENPEKEFTGYWRLIDEAYNVVHLHLAEDFTACSVDRAGEIKAEGKKGTWRWEDGRAVISYASGWTDILVPRESGVIKFAFAPGRSLEGNPSSRSPATKLATEEVKRNAKAQPRLMVEGHSYMISGSAF